MQSNRSPVLNRILITLNINLIRNTIMKYLIEVSHTGDQIECLRSAEIFLRSGSHFLTNADWGCLDGVHKAWFIMETDNRDDTIRIVPPAYRKDTVVTQLNKFRLQDVEELLRHHKV